MRAEPIMSIVAGGMTLLQAIFGVLIAFHVPLTVEQQVSISAVVGIILPWIARRFVTPMATLPAGVAAKMEAEKLAQN